jgi:hypothetical protein
VRTGHKRDRAIATGEIVRSGRSNDLKRRERELRRNPILKDFKFEVRYETDKYDEQRGLEQELDWTFAPPLNKIRPIDVRRRREILKKYLRAANDYLDKQP